MKKYLIAGLGNPGEKYVKTRHNIGFLVIDRLIEKENIDLSLSRYGATAIFKWKGREVILLKPSTYMNLSGDAVRYWMEKESIPLKHLLVIVDDIHLDHGKIRLRKKGSDAGHNGLKSIENALNTQKYSRLKMGIGSDYPRGMQVEYVLGNWTGKELCELPEWLQNAEERVYEWLASTRSR